MECTQRLEYTQEMKFASQVERVKPEQVGFLGICGETYPIVKGPNKIGRDPQTCDIVLNLNSISRQHAVINVLSHNQYMLMDLGSANKTKLINKPLQPYIPFPLRNGDTIQLGDIFGIFRLLECDDDLPATQAIDIPDTPINIKHLSKLNYVASTTVPESPDLSDKEDSYVASSQTKTDSKFKSPNNKYIKSSGRTIGIQPVGSNKIDNIYWNSSKKSRSFNLSLNDSTQSNDGRQSKDIYEMETQIVSSKIDDSSDSIYDANTQIPSSIYTAETQLPSEIPNTKSVTNKSPTKIENLPNVCTVQGQFEMQCDLYIANNENKHDIFTAETQVPCSISKNHDSLKVSRKDDETKPIENFEDKILFDELDSQSFMDDFESQPIVKQASPNAIMKSKLNNDISQLETINTRDQNSPNNCQKLSACENIDIIPTQKINRVPEEDEDLTDCEDDHVIVRQKNVEVKEDLTDCEDNDGNGLVGENRTLISTNQEKIHTSNKLNYENKAVDIGDDVDFSDMPTQVIEETGFLADMPTQILDENIENLQISNKSEVPRKESFFKIPIQSPIKMKRKELVQSVDTSDKLKFPETKHSKISNEDDKYYQATQDIMDDLCTQTVIMNENKTCEDVLGKIDNTSHLSPNTKSNVSNNSCVKSDFEGRIDGSNYPVPPNKDKIARDTDGLLKPKRITSDLSDVEDTPKKISSLKLMEMDLPNSQEIKTTVSLNSKTLVTESSSESDIENNNSEECTPILYRKKKKTKDKIINIKVDLSNRFDVNALPTRVTRRQRKPTMKAMAGEINATMKNILEPKLFTDQDSIVDCDIISENIARLKSKNHSKTISNIENSAKSENEAAKCKNSVKNDSQSKEKSNESKKKGKIETNMKNNDVKKEKCEKRPARERKVKNNQRKNKEENKETNKSIISTNNERKRPNENKSVVKKEIKGSRSQKKDNIGKLATHEHNINDKDEKNNNTQGSNVRRSKRQRPNKEKIIEIEDTSKKVENLDTLKSILKKADTFKDKSSVYSLDSEFSIESPVKRPGSVIDAPSSKRTRGGNISLINQSSRSTPARGVHVQSVLFTALSEPAVKQISSKLEKLGALVVQDVTSCTVLVTQQMKRTFKLLCAVALGKPIVGPNWIQACHDTNMIVDPWLYLLKDDQAEKRFSFNLHRTLVSKRQFLNCYNVSCTPNVKPTAPELKLIVEASGGKWRAEGPNWICISCAADKTLWTSLKRKGATVVTSEFILGGVLKQEIDITGNLLT